MPARSDPRPQQRLRLVLDELERERSELAHELHEQVAQALAAVLLGLDSLGSADGSEDSESKIAAVREHVAGTLEHCRALAVSLRPPLLDQLGLVPALERLAQHAGAERVSVDPALTRAALGPALRTQVYRCVEDALAPMASARSLTISLDPGFGDVRISVQSRDEETHAGELGSLEARLELVGGTLAASSGELVIRIPIEEDASAAVAVFPQSHRVEIPDGERRALP